MEKTVTLNLRVNPVIKQQAEQVLRQLGIPMSTAIDMYLRQITLKGGIPFPVNISAAPQAQNADAMTDSELHAAIAEGLRDTENGSYREASDAFRSFRQAHQI